MKKIICFRLTKTKTFVLNNRWGVEVKPKCTLFFLPADEAQLRLWIKFLCFAHHRNYLYVHMLCLYARKHETRVLTKYKGLPLIEVLVNTKDYRHVIIKKRSRVSPTTRKIMGLKSFLSTNKSFL